MKDPILELQKIKDKKEAGEIASCLTTIREIVSNLGISIYDRTVENVLNEMTRELKIRGITGGHSGYDLKESAAWLESYKLDNNNNNNNKSIVGNHGMLATSPFGPALKLACYLFDNKDTSKIASREISIKHIREAKALLSRMADYANETSCLYAEDKLFHEQTQGIEQYNGFPRWELVPDNVHIPERIKNSYSCGMLHGGESTKRVVSSSWRETMNFLRGTIALGLLIQEAQKS